MPGLVAALLSIAMGFWGWLSNPEPTASLTSIEANQASAVESPRFQPKPIEEIEVGDHVWSRDPSTGEFALRRVEAVFHRTSDHLRHLTFTDAEGAHQTLSTTDEHPFFVADRSGRTPGIEVPASDLSPGDEVIQIDGTASLLTATLRDEVPDGVAVFNFRVAGFHTYHVSASPRGPPLWVHNADCSPEIFNITPPAPNSGLFGGIVANTAEEASFLRNVAATFGDSSVFRTAVRHRGNIVIQRSDIPLSIQNLRRMQSGNSPFVRNAAGEWEALNLHHVGRQDGKLIEIFSSHNTYNPATGGPLHIPGPGGPLRQSRLSQTYWQQRLDDLINSGQISDDLLRKLGR